MSVVGAFLALLAAQGAVAAEDSRSLWFLRQYETGHWCGYNSKAGFDEAAKAAGMVVESAEVRYHSGVLANVIHDVRGESGDWMVIDSYAFGKDGSQVERSATRLDPSYHIVSSARIGGTRPVRLHRIRVEPKDLKASTIADGPIPDMPIMTSADAFPFLKLASALRSGEREEICEPDKPRQK